MDEKLIRQTLEQAKKEVEEYKTLAQEEYKRLVQEASNTINLRLGMLLGKVAALEALLAPPEVKKDKKEKEE